MNPPKQRHLEVVTRIRAAANLVLRLRQHLEGTHQILDRKLRRQRREALAFAFRGKLGIGESLRVDVHDEDVPGEPRELSNDETKIVP